MISELWFKGVNLIRVLWRELAKFGAVGGVAFIIDSSIFLWLIFGPMSDSQVKAKVIAGAVATLFAWVGNRYWTFRHRRTETKIRELVLFIIMNIIGLGIQAGCVFIAKYVFDLHSPAAAFVSGNVIGLGLAMCFRFVAYKFWVFTGDAQPQPTRNAAARSAQQTGSTEPPHMVGDQDILQRPTPDGARQHSGAED